jgi:molybdopterin-guanine dinucleotide biosynthesis protein A
VTDFSGAVLAGGASRRMGVDKATVTIDGRPMVARVVAALDDAGSLRTVVVGGDRATMTGLGLVHVADRWPGAGPLGGIATALAELATRQEVVVVLACDLIAPDPAAIGRTVAALDADPDADVAVPDVGGRRQWLHASWRGRAGPALEAALTGGERAIHRAVAGQRLTVATVTGIGPDAVADADTADGLPPGAR